MIAHTNIRFTAYILLYKLGANLFVECIAISASIRVVTKPRKLTFGTTSLEGSFFMTVFKSIELHVIGFFDIVTLKHQSPNIIVSMLNMDFFNEKNKLTYISLRIISCVL